MPRPPGVSATGGPVGSRASAPVGEVLRAGVRGFARRAATSSIAGHSTCSGLRGFGVPDHVPPRSASRSSVEAELDPLDRRVDLAARRHDHEAVGVLAILGRQAAKSLSRSRPRSADTSSSPGASRRRADQPSTAAA